MKRKEIIDRFFDGDEELFEEIKLTKEEIELFENQEWALLVNNGLKNINGGYSQITVYGGDEEELKLEYKCGEQNMGDGHSSCDVFDIKYNRITKKFKPN